MNFILVFIGGGLGAILRYGISIWFQGDGASFPKQTFLANVLACLLLGFLTWHIPFDHPKLKLLFATGLCGGLSTFSTFSLETFNLLEKGNLWMAFAYVMASIIVCVFVLYVLYLFLAKGNTI